MPATDPALAILDFLREDERAEEVRDLLVSSEFIQEAGQLTATEITESESRRLQMPDLDSRALAITVQDAGDKPETDERVIQDTVIRIFDRGRGYDRIRPVRNAIRHLLRLPLVFSIGEQRGMLELRYTGRTGIRFDMEAHVFYEALSYQARVVEVFDD